MPRGKKQCPTCEALVSARSSSCDCGHVFKKVKRKTPKPFFKERREFISRMLEGERSDCMKLDMMTATKIFDDFDNDLDFLSRVKPPFKLNKTIKFFLTKDGMEYLKKKKLEYDYQPTDQKEIVDHNKKAGEDILIKKKSTLIEFLNDE